MIAEGLIGRVGHGRRRLSRPRPRVLAALAAVLALVAGGWLWLRDSSLVAVTRVAITGVSGPESAQIRIALGAAARNMTTLDVHMDQLRSVVAPYPVVRDLRVVTHFPHGISIRVIEQDPVAVVVVGGRQISVAGNGTLLHDLSGTGTLPQIPLKVDPGGRRLTDPDALDAVALLSSAPSALLTRVSEVTTVAPHGLVAQIRGGPSLYFGDPAGLRAKWAAVAAVLADPGSAGALYIDVTDPARPAAGVGSSGSSSSGSGSTGDAAAAQGATSGSIPGTGSAATTTAQSTPVGG